MNNSRQWLIDLRKNEQLKQIEVAQACNITQEYYSRIELGNRNPSIKVAKRIASFLDFPFTMFYD